MTPAESAAQKRHRSEISAAVAEIHKLEPDAGEAVIERLVQTAYDELTPSRVEGYVPILVVHQVRNIISSRRLAA